MALDCFAFCSVQAQGNETSLDSLRNLLNQNIRDSIKVEVLNSIANILTGEAPDNALGYNGKAIRVADSKSYRFGLTKSYYTRAVIFYSINNWDSSSYYAQKCIDIGDQYQHAEYLAKSHNLLGSIDLHKGNNSVSLKHYLKALEIFKSVKHQSGIAASLNRVGSYYIKNKEYAQALNYFGQAKHIFEEIDRQDQVSSVLNNLGVALYQLDSLKEALAHYRQSLEVAKKNKLKTYMATRELNIGKVHLKLNQFDKAYIYLIHAYDHAVLYSNKRIECATTLQLGLLKKQQNDLSGAMNYFRNGLFKAKKIGTKDLEASFYENLADAFFEVQILDSAFIFLQKFQFLKDSLQEIEKKREVLFLQNKFEADQQQQKIILLQKDAEKKDLIIYAVVVSLILLVSLFILTFVYYSNKQNWLRLIHRHEEEINRQKVAKVLREQELNLIRSQLNGQELERKRVAKELHDGIGGTLASIKLNLVQIVRNDQSNEIDTLNGFIERLNYACEEVRTVSHNLIPPSFQHSGFVDVLEKFIINFKQDQDTKIYYEFFPKKSLNNIDPDIQVEVYRIIQELMANMIKHAKATEAHLTLTLHEEYINLMMEDDGIGFTIEQIDSGIGLKNIRSRVNVLKGDVIIDSNLGKGASINIDIPIK